MNTDKSKRIGVLMGGLSSEREISIKSGSAVLEVLIERGWDAVAIDVDDNVAQQLLYQQIDIAYNALHGVYGEDGCIQGLLEILKIPVYGFWSTSFCNIHGQNRHQESTSTLGYSFDKRPTRNKTRI